jgi:hypothetical protein
MDILRTTLASGIKVVDYVPSYGELPNDYQHVTQCKFFLLLQTTHLVDGDASRLPR